VDVLVDTRWRTRAPTPITSAWVETSNLHVQLQDVNAVVILHSADPADVQCWQSRASPARHAANPRY
jgi:hypothetical protein